MKAYDFKVKMNFKSRSGKDVFRTLTGEGESVEKAFAELKNRGVKKVYGGTLRSNEPNLRLSSKVGFKELTDIHYTNFLGHKRWRQKEIRK